MALFLIRFAGPASAAVGPCAFEAERFQGIVDRARQDPTTAQDAFAVFRAIIDEKPWTSPQEHSCKTLALEAIGKLGLPEAVPYLNSFADTDFEQVDGHRIFRAIRYALHDTLLAQISPPEDKVLYYQHQLRENDRLASAWVADRVCNTGLLTVLPAVRQYLIMHDGFRGEENAARCETRMRALAVSPDRLAALSAVLTISRRPADPELMQWAIWELMAMRSAEAKTELERFEQEALALPDDFPQQGSLVHLADEIWAYLGFPNSRRYYANGKQRAMRID